VTRPRPAVTRPRRLAIVVVACAVASASCAAAEQAVSARASGDLAGRVAQVRAAVEDGKAGRAARLLHRLERALDRWRSEGEVTEERYAEILAAARRVERNLALLSQASPTAAVSTPPDAPASLPSPSDEPSFAADEDGGNSGEGDGEPSGNAYGHEDAPGQSGEGEG
jgi:hypothetical protein